MAAGAYRRTECIIRGPGAAQSGVTFEFGLPLYVCAARHGFAFEISLAWSFTAESGAEIKGTLT